MFVLVFSSNRESAIELVTYEDLVKFSDGTYFKLGGHDRFLSTGTLGLFNSKDDYELGKNYSLPPIKIPAINSPGS